MEMQKGKKKTKLRPGVLGAWIETHNSLVASFL
jgi:hypothetical protein